MVSDKRLGFPFRRLFFVAVVVIFGYVYYDFKQAENWQSKFGNQMCVSTDQCIFRNKNP